MLMRSVGYALRTLECRLNRLPDYSGTQCVPYIEDSPMSGREGGWMLMRSVGYAPRTLECRLNRLPVSAGYAALTRPTVSVTGSLTSGRE